MAREPNKNHGACKLRSLLKKHQMTKLYKVVNDKPYLMTELITQRTIGLGKCEEGIRIEIYVKFICTHNCNHLERKNVGKVVNGFKALHSLRCDEHSTECFKCY